MANILCKDWVAEHFKRDQDLIRFWSKANKDGDTTCWLWEGGKEKEGYGLFSLWIGTNKYKAAKAHRISFALNNPNEPIPEQVCHSCDVKLCVNPSHLWSGNQLLNMKDKAKKGRNNPCPDALLGQFHQSSKLNTIDIVTIIRIAELGMPHVDIAKYFETSTANVSVIVNGKRRATEHSKAIELLNELKIKYNRTK